MASFRGGYFRDKCFHEPFLNGALSVAKVTLNEFRNIIDQNSTENICYNINRITKDEMVSAIRRVESSKGVDL